MISVCLVTYNNGRDLDRAVQSVMAQTYEDWELLILDDNSSDPFTRGYVDCAAGLDDRIFGWRFDTTDEIRKTCVTYARNINWGVQHTSGEYVTFLAGDDWHAPDAFERFIAKLEEGADVVYGSQDRPNANGRFIPEPATDVLTNAENKIDMSSVAMTREAFNRSGGFPTDPEMWGDADRWFWKRVAEAGYVFTPVADPDRPVGFKEYRHDSVQDRWNRGLTPWV